MSQNSRWIETEVDDLRIRFAEPQDTGLILQFIRRLAEYEKLAHEVKASEDGLHDALFGARPSAEAVLAYHGSDAVGFAIFYHNFSTFLGKPGLYLEDLFVEPATRGLGVGKALLLFLVRLARQRGCGRMEWSVLDWNTTAINFYRALGAVPMDDWTVFRLGEPAMAKLTRASPEAD